MAAVDRTATTVWQGDLKSGNGTLTLDSSQAGGPFEVSAAARFESPQGKTSPEELLAAAHATCFSMALSNTLSGDGHAPEQLDTTAVCSVERQEGGFTITTMKITIQAKVPDIDQDALDKAVSATEEGCPVSKALAGNVSIDVDATLV